MTAFIGREFVTLLGGAAVAWRSPRARSSSRVATRALTQTIPIVCPLLADPIHFGLIASESRPRGNVTGVLFRTEGLAGKQLSLRSK